jgi:hypothetical protein
VIELRAQCDVDGCGEAEHVAVVEPYAAADSPWMVVVDTEWLDLPDGWTVVKDPGIGGDFKVRCPAHGEG